MWNPDKVMEPSRHSCAACGRDFQQVFDYPRVRVLEFERLPVPEAVDALSAEAAEKQLKRRRTEDTGGRWLANGINMTPEIDRACKAKPVADYFARLSCLVGHEVDPRDLRPPFPVDRVFEGAHPVPGTSLYLSVHEAAASKTGGRAAEVHVLCNGPNMRSAGGPTLQVGAIALLHYEGMLAHGHQ